MTVLYTNNAGGTIATGINNSVTTISLTAGHGARFPNPSNGDYFYATLIDASNNIEIVKVTARSTDTLTVVRGVDGTLAQSFLALDKFELRPTAAGFADIQAQLASSGQYGIGLYNISNTAGFTTTRITVSAGQCRDSTNSKDIRRLTPINKDLTAPWAVGNNNGGRDTGSLAAAQTWHVFVILNPSTSVTDVLLSQSPTAPALPSGYTYFRRVGSIILEAATTDIRQFVQTGDWFKLKTRSVDYAIAINGPSPTLRQLSVPAGIKVEVELIFQSAAGSGFVNPTLSGVYDPDLGLPPVFGSPTQWAQHRASDTAARYGNMVIRQFTDTFRQVYTQSTDPNDRIVLGVLGWRDRRGQS